MQRLIVVVLTMSIFGFAVGCASTGEEDSGTRVEGAVVSQGDQDWDREYTDEEVESFAAAYVEVTNIQQRYQAQMSEAGEEERAELSRQSAAESEEAMLAHGVSPDQYNAIVLRLPDDDELRERVGNAVQQLESQRIEETQRNMDSE